jgi:hypothetical protein
MRLLLGSGETRLKTTRPIARPPRPPNGEPPVVDTPLVFPRRAGQAS